MGVGTQEYLGDRAQSISAETLILCGSDDEKYRQAADVMRAAIPRATVVVVPNAGHSVHMEQPTFCADVVKDFLA
jgi:2-succinyl-6-hydroxy-2,4-cyclohexadiene-1-carboxylate synthase